MGLGEAIFCLLLCAILFHSFFQPVLMEELIDTWRNMSLSEKEDLGFTLQSDQRSQKFVFESLLLAWQAKS